MINSDTIHINPWYDLVYHVLALLPIDAQDASRLFSSEYRDWTNRQFSKYGTSNIDVPRTSLQDADLMASIYSRTGKGYCLHSFPLLWDSIEAFEDDMTLAFNRVQWQDEHRAGLGAAVLSNLGQELPDLFRTAMWSELRNGYLAVWENAVLPAVETYQQKFYEFLLDISGRLPELAGFEWILCHPLRQHGRLLSLSDSKPVIAVGVADSGMTVSQTFPLIQGCHEYFVSTASQRRERNVTFSTQPGKEGYEYFSSIEKEALCRGARFFMTDRLKVPYLEWLSHLYPDNTEQTAESLFTAST